LRQLGGKGARRETPGRNDLIDIELATLTDAGFLGALLNTNPPQIFAESAVAGDSSD
jgi:hypothetical protein